MRVVNQVQQTNDYTLFTTLSGNREINKLHVRRLEESFTQKYLLSPIVVNSKYEIIDGQHRYTAAKHLGLPVNFIVCDGYGLSEVQLLNTNMKNWRSLDYLNAYCDMGMPAYLKFRDFMEKFPQFGFKPCEMLLLLRAGNTFHKSSKDFASPTNKKGVYTIKYFERGELVIPNYDLSVEYANKILQVSEYYEKATQALFVAAMIGVFKCKGYDHDVFIRKLQLNPGAIQDARDVRQFKEQIEEAYNFKNRNKVNLRF